MDHKNFIDELQNRLGSDKKTLNTLLSATMQVVKDKAVMMDAIVITGFGTFEPRKKLERVSINPATGKRMLIPPKIVLSFKPAGAIRTKLKERPYDE